MNGRYTLGLVCCAAGGVESIREGLVQPMIDAGWSVAVTSTPTASEWLSEIGETARLSELTGFAVRSASRLPSEESPHPAVDCWAVVPATANTVAKLALGVADNQALTSVNQAVGSASVPVIVFPRVNAGHVSHPAWASHVAALRSAGCTW